MAAFRQSQRFDSALGRSNTGVVIASCSETGIMKCLGVASDAAIRIAAIKSSCADYDLNQHIRRETSVVELMSIMAKNSASKCTVLRSSVANY